MPSSSVSTLNKSPALGLVNMLESATPLDFCLHLGQVFYNAVFNLG